MPRPRSRPARAVATKDGAPPMVSVADDEEQDDDEEGGEGAEMMMKRAGGGVDSRPLSGSAGRLVAEQVARAEAEAAAREAEDERRIEEARVEAERRADAKSAQEYAASLAEARKVASDLHEALEVRVGEGVAKAREAFEAEVAHERQLRLAAEAQVATAEDEVKRVASEVEEVWQRAALETSDEAARAVEAAEARRSG